MSSFLFLARPHVPGQPECVVCRQESERLRAEGHEVLEFAFDEWEELCIEARARFAEQYDSFPVIIKRKEKP